MLQIPEVDRKLPYFDTLTSLADHNLRALLDIQACRVENEQKSETKIQY